MANPHKGELNLSAGGQTYTLRISTNACAEMEDLAKGRTFRQVAMGVQLGSIRDVRLLLWAALREKHADIAADGQPGLRKVGELLDVWQEDDAVVAQLQALLGLNADTGQEKAAAGGRPQKARTGTGVRSRSSAAPPA